MALVFGIILLLGSTYGYFHSPGLVMRGQQFTSTSAQLMPNVGRTDSGSHLFDLNQAQTTKMIKITQYGFIILAISGVAGLIYGIVAKKQGSIQTKEKFS